MSPAVPITFAYCYLMSVMSFLKSSTTNPGVSCFLLEVICGANNRRFFHETYTWLAIISMRPVNTK